MTMYHVVLFEPEIPQNTGNVIRLCANAGCRLHLIEPLGFQPDDRKLRRAGLDYHDWATVTQHPTYNEFQNRVRPGRTFMFSTHHTRRYTEPRYQPGDALVFGPETRGLPPALRRSVDPSERLCLPMRPYNRSLNLSNTVGIVVYEAWRQVGFRGAAEG